MKSVTINHSLFIPNLKNNKKKITYIHTFNKHFLQDEYNKILCIVNTSCKINIYIFFKQTFLQRSEVLARFLAIPVKSLRNIRDSAGVILYLQGVNLSLSLTTRVAETLCSNPCLLSDFWENRILKIYLITSINGNMLKLNCFVFVFGERMFKFVVVLCFVMLCLYIFRNINSSFIKKTVKASIARLI